MNGNLWDCGIEKSLLTMYPRMLRGTPKTKQSHTWYSCNIPDTISPYSGIREMMSSRPACQRSQRVDIRNFRQSYRRTRNGRPRSANRGDASSQNATVRIWLYILAQIVNSSHSPSFRVCQIVTRLWASLSVEGRLMPKLGGA